MNIENKYEKLEKKTENKIKRNRWSILFDNTGKICVIATLMRIKIR